MNKSNMRRTVAAMTGLAALIAGTVALAAGEKNIADSPEPIAGKIENPQAVGVVRDRLGDWGVVVVRDMERWKNIQTTQTEAGWKKPDKFALADHDFAKGAVVLAYKYGVGGMELSLKWAGVDAKDGFDQVNGELKHSAQEGGAQKTSEFVFAAVGAQQSGGAAGQVKETRVTVSGAADGAASKVEFQRVFKQALNGDVVGGLEGTVKAVKDKIKPGNDIGVEFTLTLAEKAMVAAGGFVPKLDAVKVWDTKYSEGYRNYAFHVVKPDGKVEMLRPKEQLDWDKNAPHPVTITAKEPYVLEGWGVNAGSSLKALGLDTTKEGKYEITGIFMESGGEGGRGGQMWSGDLWTNTVVVVVEK